MDTSTTTFCRFSPLKTPTTKLKLQDGGASDTESLASVVTTDLHKLAKSVTKKLNKGSHMMSSDDDLFISQSKKVSSPMKSAKKRHISESKSNASPKDSSSESETETNRSPVHKKQKMVCDKKGNKYLHEDFNAEKNLKSNVTSSKKYGQKHNGHDISESLSDISSSDSDSSEKSKKSGSVLTSDSSSRRAGSIGRINSRSSTEGTDDEKDAESDNNSRSDESDISDSLEHSKPLKTTRTENKKLTDKGYSLSESKEFRYEIPDNFEVGKSDNYLSKSDIQGKQLWLITVPDDFDISTLHKQKIKLTGSSFITDVNLQTEKQYEVVGRPFTQQMSNYCNASSQVPGSEDFVLGSQLSGQLQVMDWIPCMPKVELVIPHHQKHWVPDNLKPTFVPFGSESPQRDIEADCLAGQKDKHKKKKKEKKKKKKGSYAE